MSFRKLGAKDPNATVSYQVDWTAYFAALDDTLDSAQVDVVDSTGTSVDAETTLVVAAVQQTAAGIVTFYLSGGTPDVDHYVRCRVTGARTSPAQIVDEVTVVIPVNQR